MEWSSDPKLLVLETRQSLAFGIFYWILDTMRLNVVHGQTLIDSLFPGGIAFWLRFLVVLFLLLFGIIYAILRSSSQRGIAASTIYPIASAMGLIFWLVSAFRDFMLGQGRILNTFLASDAEKAWGRILPLAVIFLDAMVLDHRERARRMREENDRVLERTEESLRRYKGEFFEKISRDLREPIGRIRSDVDHCLQNAGTLDAEQQRHMTRVLEDIHRLTKLVGSLTEISSLESGTARLRRGAVAIRELLHSALANHRPRAGRRQVEFKTDLTTENLVIYADRDSLEFVFNTLLKHAAESAEPGSTIRIQMKTHGDSIETRIDFKPMEQGSVEPGRTKKPEDSIDGVDLTMIHRLIEKHGGGMAFFPGEGERLEIRFTLKKRGFPAILVVDDTEEVVDMIQSILERENYIVHTAFNGESAIRKLQSETISLILLDLNLPGMSGYEVIGRIKQNRLFSAIPVVIVSGYSVNTQLLEHIDDHSTFPVLEKPFQPARLIEIIEELLAE